MTAHDPSRRYREVQVSTAAKDDLLLLLVDGGVRFAEGALLELEKGKEEDRARRNDQLLRAQKIVLELISSLSPSIGDEIYQNLQALYRFTFQRLFEGNVKSDRRLVGEGLTMMKRIRDLWKATVERAREEGAKVSGTPPSGSSLSVTG